MNKFFQSILLVLVSLTTYPVYAVKNLPLKSLHLTGAVEDVKDISIQQHKAANDQPTAFAVNVHGVIINDVRSPYSSYTHTMDNFNRPTLVAENSEDNLRPLVITWTADKSTMYALTIEDERYLLRINPENGITTRLSKLTGYPSSQMIQGMAIDENNTCYIVATDSMNHNTKSYLYTCNLMTGALTFVGSQALAPDVHDIAATCDGKIYGVDSNRKNLYTIDKFNGSATLVGSLGITSDVGLFALTYDRQNGELYQYVLNTSGHHTALGRISQSDGSLTFVSDAYKFGFFVGGVKSSCDDQVETFALNPGFNGTWFNPATDGQGFLFDVLPESNTFFAAWFTFDDAEVVSDQNAVVGSAEQRWFTAQGTLGDTNTVELSIYNTSGGVFDDLTAVNSAVVGTMTVNFENCSEGLIEYEMNDGSLINTIPIQRVAGDNIAMCESFLNAANLK